MPRSIFCKSSTEKKFSCEHVSQARLDIQTPSGKMVSYFKCTTLNNQLHDLNKEGRREGEKGAPFQKPTQPENSDSPES